MGIVIGKSGFQIPNDKAMDHVFGFTVAHDVSARDWQLGKNGGQWLLGKAMNGFCPIGPSIVTPDEIADPHHLNLKCIVNGVTKQDSNTKQLVFKTENCFVVFKVLYPITWRSDLDRYTSWSWMLQKSSR